MRLTLHSDYALRVLIFAALHPDRLCTIREIAGSYGISKNHLLKVTQALGRAGLLATVRGRNGGIRLARPASEIILGEVVRRSEPDLALVECFDRATNTCPIAGPCGLSGVIDEALRAFLVVLDRHTLADLVRRPGALLRRLSGGERQRAHRSMAAASSGKDRRRRLDDRRRPTPPVRAGLQ